MRTWWLGMLLLALAPVAAGAQLPSGHHRVVPPRRPVPPHHGVHRHRHHRAGALPVLIGAPAMPASGTCEDAAALLRENPPWTGPSEQRVVTAYVVEPGTATGLLYGLRAAGYHEVRLVGLEALTDGTYRASFRLGPRDASVCS